MSPKKLNLKKDTVRTLSGAEMQGVVGGVAFGVIAKMHCSDHCCTKSCSTCGCPKGDFGNVILPAFNQLRAF
ncbi:MAG: class I lanthipeptide [Pirellulales bacterium]